MRTLRTASAAAIVAIALVTASTAAAAVPAVPVLPPPAFVVASILGYPFPVTCAQVRPGVEGVTQFADGGRSVVWVALSPHVCADEASTEWFKQAWGLLDTIHEAEHVRYVSRDEALTECRALRDFPRVLYALLPRTDAVADVQLVQMETMIAYGYSAALPDNYQGGQCGADGAEWLFRLAEDTPGYSAPDYLAYALPGNP